MIDWWLSLRVYGINESLRPILPRRPFDSAEALRQSIIPEQFHPEAAHKDRSRHTVTSTSGCWPFDCGNDGRIDEFERAAAAANTKSDTYR